MKTGRITFPHPYIHSAFYKQWLSCAKLRHSLYLVQLKRLGFGGVSKSNRSRLIWSNLFSNFAF
jgi:hypothetical protein